LSNQPVTKNKSRIATKTPRKVTSCQNENCEEESGGDYFVAGILDPKCSVYGATRADNPQLSEKVVNWRRVK